MPELPDIAVYIEALETRVLGQELEGLRIANPFLLRSVEPPVKSAVGRRVARLRRLGKRIAIGLEGELWLVLHLMIAGRLHWAKPGAKLPGRRGLAAFDFPEGSLILTEAGPSAAPRCTWWPARRRWRPTTRAASRCWRRSFRPSGTRWRGRTIR